MPFLFFLLCSKYKEVLNRLCPHLAFIEPVPNAQRMFCTSALPSHSNLALLLHKLSVMFPSVLPSPSVRNERSCVLFTPHIDSPFPRTVVFSFLFRGLSKPCVYHSLLLLHNVLISLSVRQRQRRYT